MTSVPEEKDTIQLTTDELAVAAAIEAISMATDRSVHRTTLLAIVDAAREQPSLTEAELLTRLDREQISDALLTLRASNLAVLDETGFRLTDTGEKRLASVEHEGDLPMLMQALKGLVGTKFSEWAMV